MDMKQLQEENDRLKKLHLVKADIISISAHQIRTSISAIKWIIKMFLDGDLGPVTEEQANLLRKAYESNEKAITIVSELLLVNKTEDITEKEYSIEEINLTELIESAIFNFSGEAFARGIEVIFLKSDKALPKVSGDKEKISVVMQNLLENAIKYSNMHGKVFITLKHDEENVTFSIKDIGVVISEEGKGKIFEKFYRDPDAQKKEAIGSGIGLYTIKKIIERHKGKIWFESTKENGTTFYFTIPIA
jgi:signal transduction histidine kinase